MNYRSSLGHLIATITLLRNSKECARARNLEKKVKDTVSQRLARQRKLGKCTSFEFRNVTTDIKHYAVIANISQENMQSIIDITGYEAHKQPDPISPRHVC